MGVSVSQVAHANVFGFEEEPNSILFIPFIPSKDKDGNDLPEHENQEMWVHAAARLLGRLFGGATIMSPARETWLNEDTDELISEQVMLVHSYARRSDAEDEGRLLELARFLHRMGRQTNQGEVGVVIDNVFHRIRKFTLA